MSSDDKVALKGDVLTAIALLSRIPVRADFSRGARASWAYPLAGAAIGIAATIPTWAALTLGLQPMLSALIYIAVSIIASGAMHEDGLADCADGFWGGWDRQRRLDIMKDSRIGAYGVITLCLSLAARWLAVGLILQSESGFESLIMVAILSRATMPAIMTVLPQARQTGLSHAQGTPSHKTSALAVILALLLAALLTGFSGLLLGMLAGVTTIACGAIAQVKIGGQTGDVLGATQQIAEITLLLAITI
ncbi:adenosylcobinamide-GDP ribazoletransferase [Pseudopelagicola sp. nBUS_20]|uniref:adenosylcobinamide-GDP ribazoletransferase n=1 Tax=Pseudopelagicola sp. nBUS_20 TaxID=3395317 RepID=UPI003EBADA25